MMLSDSDRRVLQALKAAGVGGRLSAIALAEDCQIDLRRLPGILRALEQRGLIKQTGAHWRLRNSARELL